VEAITEAGSDKKQQTTRAVNSALLLDAVAHYKPLFYPSFCPGVVALLGEGRAIASDFGTPVEDVSTTAVLVLS
jgi:hypothetical protein